LKILHLYKDFHPVLGGIENHIRLLARLQRQRGHDVTVLVTHEERTTREEVLDGIRVIKAGRVASFASTPLSWDFARWVGRLDADVTHLHFPYPPAEVANLLWGRGRRTVVTYHSDVVRQKWILRLYEPLLWRALRGADRILATNEPYVRSSRYLREFADKIDVVPLGIELERFQAAPTARAEEIRKWALAEAPSCDRVIVSVGRLRYYKGLDTLISALRSVDAVLLIVGSGPMRDSLEAQAAREGIADRVRFAGDVPDEELASYYHAGDLYVSSASHRSEAFGISIIEAMACGLPIISTELGTGTSFVNRSGETGVVVAPSDPEALASAVRTLLADTSQLRTYGQQARRRAATEFSDQVMVERVLASYRRVLAEAVPSAAPASSGAGSPPDKG
jgi:glycosyltransferase involved in cell wall biosynthesis